jgi:hypothetical protein
MRIIRSIFKSGLSAVGSATSAMKRPEVPNIVFTGNRYQVVSWSMRSLILPWPVSTRLCAISRSTYWGWSRSLSSEI